MISSNFLILYFSEVVGIVDCWVAVTLLWRVSNLDWRVNRSSSHLLASGFRVGFNAKCNFSSF